MIGDGSPNRHRLAVGDHWPSDMGQKQEAKVGSKARQWGDVCVSCESTGSLCVWCGYCENCNHVTGCIYPFRVTKDGISSKTSSGVK